MENNIKQMAYEYAHSTTGNVVSLSKGFIGGYEAAQKQLFTLEDIKKAFMEGSHWKEKWNKEVQNGFDEFFNFPDVDKYIESLQK